MLRIAIIGCGKIADQHVGEIGRLPGCEIVGVCDREILMARQLGERLNLKTQFSEVEQLLEETKPDVVHITTPPKSHYTLGKLAMEAGCHVYMEKPFTVTYEDARKLIEVAHRHDRKITVGHNAQFSHAANEMRSMVRKGHLGGSPVHMESYYCYNLSDAGYAKAVLGDRYHWVRSLPGGLLQNTISHGICRIAEFMTGDSPAVIARGFTSELLKSIGEHELVDELRVTIYDGHATAYFTFSSQMRPSLHLFRIFGPKNAIVMDEYQQSTISLRGDRYKSFLEQFLPGWDFAKQYVGCSIRNIQKFLTTDLHAGYGMKILIGAFYRSIATNSQPPIAYDEILRTAKIMEDIFAQLALERPEASRSLEEMSSQS